MSSDPDRYYCGCAHVKTITVICGVLWVISGILAMALHAMTGNLRENAQSFALVFADFLYIIVGLLTCYAVGLEKRKLLWPIMGIQAFAVVMHVITLICYIVASASNKKSNPKAENPLRYIVPVPWNLLILYVLWRCYQYLKDKEENPLDPVVTVHYTTEPAIREVHPDPSAPPAYESVASA
uniref:Conserved plasma membrane protein n=1 Tax=Steinernema glaseri TaxID=37863 RepID=A0A1I7Z5D9_9BILA